MPTLAPALARIGVAMLMTHLLSAHGTAHGAISAPASAPSPDRPAAAWPTPLAGPGDAARGQAIVQARQVGLCVLCHSGPFGAALHPGNLAPTLAGVGARMSAGQLRLRLMDSRQLNPDSIMPPYFATEGLSQVGAAYQGKTLLSAQQIEDVLAYLLTLQ